MGAIGETMSINETDQIVAAILTGAKLGSDKHMGAERKPEHFAREFIEMLEALKQAKSFGKPQPV
jgi:hypothetical protein